MTEATSAHSSPAVLDSLHYADFLPHCPSTFQAILQNGQAENAPTFALEFISVTENSPVPERQEQFVLLLRAPSETSPLQGIYHLSHEQLGSGELFLVPVRRDASGLYFEAVFNRPIMAGAGR